MVNVLVITSSLGHIPGTATSTNVNVGIGLQGVVVKSGSPKIPGSIGSPSTTVAGPTGQITTTGSQTIISIEVVSGSQTPIGSTIVKVTVNVPDVG